MKLLCAAGLIVILGMGSSQPKESIVTYAKIADCPTGDCQGVVVVTVKTPVKLPADAKVQLLRNADVGRWQTAKVFPLTANQAFRFSSILGEKNFNFYLYPDQEEEKYYHEIWVKASVKEGYNTFITLNFRKLPKGERNGAPAAED